MWSFSFNCNNLQYICNRCIRPCSFCKYVMICLVCNQGCIITTQLYYKRANHSPPLKPIFQFVFLIFLFPSFLRSHFPSSYSFRRIHSVPSFGSRKCQHRWTVFVVVVFWVAPRKPTRQWASQQWRPSTAFHLVLWLTKSASHGLWLRARIVVKNGDGNGGSVVTVDQIRNQGFTEIYAQCALCTLHDFIHVRRQIKDQYKRGRWKWRSHGETRERQARNMTNNENKWHGVTISLRTGGQGHKTPVHPNPSPTLKPTQKVSKILVFDSVTTDRRTDRRTKPLIELRVRN